MKRMPTVLIALLAVAGPAVAPAVGQMGTAAAPATLAESLRRTELAFAATVRAKDHAAFLSYVAEDAVFLGGETQRGRDSIGAAWAGFFEPAARTLHWEPSRVEVLDNGELGLSTGPWWIEAVSESGRPVTVRGEFFSVWRRQADGSWKIVFDFGTSGRVDEETADGREAEPSGADPATER